jgi:hypothetical protein
MHFMVDNFVEEPSTFARIITIIEKMPEEEKEGLLRKLRLQEAMRLAKQHDERVRQYPRELTDDEIVEIVRNVRHELAENDKVNS